VSTNSEYTVEEGFETCPWTILVPSGHPEPDFPSDCWTEVECGSPVVTNKYGSWRCEAGHEHVSFDDPARRAWDMAEAFRERYEEGGW
jgi:hypothetical protein